MTYTQHGDRVTLDMTRDDFDNLLLAVGYAAGASRRQDEMPTHFWGLMRLANELNNGNPNFTPYEIPEEYRT